MSYVCDAELSKQTDVTYVTRSSKRIKHWLYIVDIVNQFCSFFNFLANIDFVNINYKVKK